MKTSYHFHMIIFLLAELPSGATFQSTGFSRKQRTRELQENEIYVSSFYAAGKSRVCFFFTVYPLISPSLCPFFYSPSFFFYVETRIYSKSAQVVILPKSLNLSPYEASQACIIITRHLSTSLATCTISFSWILYICYTSVTKASFKILKES